VVRFRRLYPQSPYTVGINTLYVPSVESTLLHFFVSKGNFKYAAAARLVFQDTLQDTITYMRQGYHVQAKHKVNAFLRINDDNHTTSSSPTPPTKTFSVPSIDMFVSTPDGRDKVYPWTIPPEHVVWTPKHLQKFAGENAIDYYCVLALFFRVNGANSLYQRMLTEVYNKKLPVNNTLLSKVTAFKNRHVQMAQQVDSLEFPTDSALSVQDVCSGGPTHYIQDADMVQVTTYNVPLQQTPLEVLHSCGVTEAYELDEFTVPSEEAMGAIAHDIRELRTDDELVRMFVAEIDGEEVDHHNHEEEESDDDSAQEYARTYRLEHFYPVRMKSAAECRAHSWYLACLVIINSAYRELKAVEDTRARPMVDKHELHVKYAFHRIMVSYVQLMLNALTPYTDNNSGAASSSSSVSRYRISDDDWRPQPDGYPTLLDRYFPRDTFAFHAGDLPSLESVLSQVGWCGLQVVKDKIPLVKIFMKSLPVCCQCRDLVSALLTECRAPKSEGFWRVVRAMFWCSFAGLYPHARSRPDFPSLMFIYDLLFNRKERFLAALENEMIQYKTQESRRRKTSSSGGGGVNGVTSGSSSSSSSSAAATSKTTTTTTTDEDNNQTSRLVYTVFREFFVHSMRNDHDWLERIQQKIDWKTFVVVTLNTADKMRMYGAFGEAPAGNELMFAINAVWRETSGSSKQVYRYKKHTYEQLVQTRLHVTQDRLHRKKLEIASDIAMTTYILDQLQSTGALTKNDIFSMYGHVDLVREFGKVDPTTLYEKDPQRFVQVMRGVMTELTEKHVHLAYNLDQQVKSNIKTYLTRVNAEKRLQFDVLLDPSLGGIELASVQALYWTQHVYATRSSPKSITTSIESMPVRDIRIIAWYFNILNRLGDISLFPLDLATVNGQISAMRTNRFRLMDDEPVPLHAWDVYVTICCGRITTFADQSTVGNLRMSYDIVTGEYVCSKKMGRTMKAKATAAKNAANARVVEGEEEEEEQEKPARKVPKHKPKQSTAANTSKRAQIDRKNDSFLSCDNQPVMCINIFGHALMFGGERYMFCPQCAQFHTYNPLGWSKGYACMTCRGAEVNKAKLKQCAYCKRQDRVEFGEPVELMVLERDPSNPGFEPLLDPMRCFQCVHMCKQDMKSIGVFERVPVKRLYSFTPKEDLWDIIPTANTDRMIKNVQKFGR